MSNKKSPLNVVKEKFGSKEALVEVLLGFSQKVFGDEAKTDKDIQRKKFLRASNAKLLVLHKTAQVIESKFGSKEKMVDKLLTLVGQAKDGDYRKKLLARSIGFLLDKVSSYSKKKTVQAPSA